MEASKIQWTDCTFNPWRGCQKIAPGCKFCYAETLVNGRMQGDFARKRVRLSDAGWKDPLKWNRNAEPCDTCTDGTPTRERPWFRENCPKCDGRGRQRPRVFCASLADVFEDWDGPIVDHKGRRVFTHVDVNASAIDGSIVATMSDLRADLFRLIDATPNLDWLLLTKRPENIRQMWPIAGNGKDPGAKDYAKRENVWLGTSVSDQETADKQIPELLKCRDLSPVLFVSAEPLLGPINWHKVWEHCGPSGVDFPGYTRTSRPPIDWVIFGGESGSKSRPCHIDWISQGAQQCKDAGVAVFVKQLGSHVEANDVIDAADYFPGYVRLSAGHNRGGRGLGAFHARVHLKDKKGGDPAEWPAVLRVREFPDAQA